ncbi:inner membrane protein import complex subunit Tim54-domain-containing protein [Mycena floridula]|nr:inner membrane protein import complex subunit Tim54-domain-containing protein [Mycena floridula]
MSTSNVPSSSTPPVKLSGAATALQYTGIPVSWLSKRPKLPSRNWLIFLGVTSTIAGSYIYDRQQCKRIKQEYIDKVKHFAEELPPDHFTLPRKVKVYACKWPGDEDFEQGVKYFKKYVKPIFVAAAVDYDIFNGKKHGDLAELIAQDIKAQRRVDVGLDPPPSRNLPPNFPDQTPEERRQYELQGGIVIIGRPAWREFMCGMKRGWSESLEKVDKEEMLARELELDGRFDELDPADELGKSSNIPSGVPSFSPLLAIKPVPKPASTIPPHLDIPPETIQPVPSLLLVPFIDYIGFKQIPIMIWGFFNHREKVRSGAEAAYRLVMGETRPLECPTDLNGGDLDFDLEVESYYRPNELEIDKAREKYYAALPEKLKTARELARGEREPTKDEVKYPPPTEVELRAERMKKEKRWRGDVAGWEIVKPGKPVEWDERFRGFLKVFV